MQKADTPINKIECDNQSPVLGKIMTGNANMNKAVDDRLRKANAVWNKIKNSYIANEEIDKKNYDSNFQMR